MADESEQPVVEPADAGKDVKAEEIGEPVRFRPYFFFHFHFYFVCSLLFAERS
jgi:hypothetical protein